MTTESPTTYVYYENIDGEAGLAELTADGLRESGISEYGTSLEIEWDSFIEFVQGADGEMYSFDDLSQDDDGFYYPDAYVRFKVIRGHEVGRDDWEDF
jgi:hypothetical protein